MSDQESHHNNLIRRLHAEFNALDKERNVIIQQISELNISEEIKNEVIYSVASVYFEKLARIAAGLWHTGSSTL